MPIKIPKDLPAFKVLSNENIFVMNNERAVNQDIRPLKIAILNSRNQLIKIQDIASGGIDFVNIEVKEILTEPDRKSTRLNSSH